MTNSISKNCPTVLSSLLFQGNHTYTFIDNVAQDGGAIFADKVSHLHFHSNSTFRNNSAQERGGGIYVTSAQFTGSSTFESNSAKKGGGVFANDGPLTLVDSSFKSNSAKHGGGMHVSSKRNSRALYICVGCAFRRNSAEYGGGVYMDENTMFHFNSAMIFKENAAVFRGGGIYASFGNTIIMYGDCHFANNYAINDGGGIYANMFSDVSFQRDSTFINNSAQQHGGGLYINESNVTFANSSKFEWNSAVSGGGIYVLPTTDTDVFSNVSLHRNTTFMHNSAKDTGGAIHADFGTFLKITGISVFGNNSAHRGGSLYSSRWCQFEFSGSILFENNSASDTGGGIYLSPRHDPNMPINTCWPKMDG